MKLDKDMINLICELEHIVGQECFNPHSYDGYTGEEGRDFRYPVWAKSGAEERKFFGRIASVPPEDLSTIKYKFGANHLYIGIALNKILNFLEKKYNLNFNDLNQHHS